MAPNGPDPLHTRHAGALRPPTVDLHQAVVAQPYAAKGAAPFPMARDPLGRYAGPGKRHGDGVAGQYAHRFAFELEADRLHAGTSTRRSPSAVNMSAMCAA